MSHQFKPGDLAILLTDVETLGAGSTVTLDRFASKGTIEVDVVFGADVWIFDHPSIPAGCEGFVEPKYLMPLRGNFSPEGQKAMEVKSCL